MSKLSDIYKEDESEELSIGIIRLAELEERLIGSSEKEKCRLLNIPCSFGICDECDIYYQERG